MLLQPHCKINIGLDILRRREDGYHDIDTLMIPVGDVCDTLEITASDGEGIKFDITGMEVDCAAGRNLVVRAWMLFRERYGIGGVVIKLHKQIPMGAGLGGGSADAAFTLKGLNELFGTGLSTTELESLAAMLGSDVPFFITDRPMFCSGRGEVLTPSTIDLKGMRCVIVKPSFGISTAEAYAGVTPKVPEQPLRERLLQPIESWQSVVVNAFEDSLLKKNLALRSLKANLMRCGAIYASLSGSGSAMFGLFDGEPNYKPLFADEKVFSVTL